jgi:hypothetical protein
MYLIYFVRIYGNLDKNCVRFCKELEMSTGRGRNSTDSHVNGVQIVSASVKTKNLVINATIDVYTYSLYLTYHVTTVHYLFVS